MTRHVAVIGGVDMIQRVFDSDKGPCAAFVGFGFTAIDRIGPLKQFFADGTMGRN